MEIFVVKADEIIRRLDCFFYNPSNVVELKSKYEIKRLKEIAEDIIHPPEYKRIYSAKGYQLLRAQNVKPLSIDIDVNQVFFSKDYFKDKTVIFPEIEDVLIVRSGVNTGDCAVVEKELTNVIIGADNLICKCKPNINPSFLGIFLNLDIGKKLLKRQITGATNSHITPENLGHIEVIIPSDEIQNKIINSINSSLKIKKKKTSEAHAILSSLYDFAVKELNLNYDLRIRKFFGLTFNDIKQRIDPLYYTVPIYDFLKTCKCDIKTIGEVTEYLKSGFAAGKSDQDLTGKGIIQIRPTNLSEDREFIFDKNVYIDKDKLGEKKEDVLIKGEVLFNNTNSQEQVGKTLVFNLDGNFFCSNHITRIKVKESEILPDYLALVLNIYQKYNIFFRICTNWNNQSGINNSLLKTLNIPVLKLSEQKRIVSEVNSRRDTAFKLRKEAIKPLKNAKFEAEKLILG